jgi:hypothetical protein
MIFHTFILFFSISIVSLVIFYYIFNDFNESLCAKCKREQELQKWDDDSEEDDSDFDSDSETEESNSEDQSTK